MKHETFRDLVVFTALGIMLRENGDDFRDVLSAANIDGLGGIIDASPYAGADADVYILAEAKLMVRELADKILVAQPATLVEPEDALETLVAE